MMMQLTLCAIIFTIKKQVSFAMEFRKDINALRSIAVLSVIIFHFNSDYLPGGFAGVDIFFVISGYLMTKIILSGINDNKFSLKRFYLARAKRIVPALTITCLVTMLIGWLFIKPSDFYEMGKDVASSILFISNFLYLSRSGYFDDSSVNNFLLHTWSLSVEWQFYIIYPLLLLAITKSLGIKAAKHSIVIMFICSFFASLYGTYNFAEASYFMFPTRAWAMLAGGMAFTIPSIKQMKRAISIVGLLLIALSFFIINKDTPWPGLMAIIPVLGSFLFIYSNSSLRFYNFKPLQYIGSVSYEIYLVHWPLLVFSRKLSLDINFAWYALITVIISVTFHKSLEISKSNKKLPITFAACLVPCLLIISNNGYTSRVPEQFRITKEDFHKKYYGGANYPSNEVFYLNSGENDFKYIITGDSFGLQYAKSFDEHKVSTAALFDHGCLIFPNYSRYLNNQEDVSCSEEYNKLKNVMAKAPTAPLIFASSWDTYNGILIKKGGDTPIGKDKDNYYSLVLSEILSVIRDGGSERMYFIIGRPQAAKVDGFSCLAGESLLGYKLISNCEELQKKENVEINRYLQKHLAHIKNVIFIDPNDALCDDDAQCKIIYQREPIYTDGGHLSIYGAELVTKYIVKHF
ncbi:TPA: acyltransferase family protein [Escherichia coli]|uniref:acyltransferase family protein n=1 Tax=Enterobacteriaceae TaxID=543 RepID=UPI0015EAE04F|nr:MULTISPECIES: acyltransferase family protein [Enterobacteriaceae]QLW25031.1 acyltransferase family protein [Enterobacter sp. RHBSTW-00422]HBP8875749.1 acyltransferase family protein [Escherichia coli]